MNKSEKTAIYQAQHDVISVKHKVGDVQTSHGQTFVRSYVTMRVRNIQSKWISHQPSRELAAHAIQKCSE